jgi:hypothetical protein
MATTNQIIRRASSLVDTSGQLPPVLTSLRMESGVYVSSGNTEDDLNSILQGRISLGIIGIGIVGALAFYYITRDIQGGGLSVKLHGTAIIVGAILGAIYAYMKK